MTDLNTKLEIFDAIAARRNERRGFLRFAGGSALAIGGASLLAACGNDDEDLAPAPTPTPSPTPAATINDADILNYALNLEYLEAQFYAFAAFGVGLNASLLTGTGTQGAVTGGAQVPFQDAVVREYAREIAIDEVAHVAFLRTALGTAAVAQPAIDISVGTVAAPGAFTAAARAAGVVSASQVFNPYADDNSFLLGAYIFEDVGVSAYKGAAALIANKTYLEAAAGILAAEAYHAGLIRTILYRKGLQTPSLRTIAGQISDARDSLDGSSDIDQGITGTDATMSNIVPTDANGLAYSRSIAQVHNIAYLTNTAKIGGGFFPNGTNNRTDALRTSGANA
ncbi:ferritin-like domain-containing protein [Sphingomonas albertensis]|uniref:Ferritin-like domain-containing protein n=1 Tax=Sphingomonas albertensis TaxID=2762591 RepID=A0ABR7ANS7_9SPHN|nr:ferritin-like domain-containing protein [Sphingomonas albertensis]MBC3942102.1 ferritin-like domain-containing protein [Sphingomonas albertensis]